MASQFNNKTVIITGASAGVGAACAKAFADLGANLVLVARNQQGLDNINQQLSPLTSVTTLAMNVNDMAANQALITLALAQYGRIDVLINNAGLHQRGELEKNNAEDLAAMVDINLRAPIQLSRLVLPYVQQTKGAIVNIGSLAGRTPLQGAATYSATKAGLRAFSYALADEMREQGVQVGLVSPGPIDTGFIMEEIEQVEDIVFSQPMSSAEQVAEAVIDVARGKAVEICLPKASGWLTTLSYLSPSLRRLLRPALNRKGRKAKQAYKLKQAKKT